MFARFSVKKPYTVLVGVILVIVLGVVSVTRMVADLLPNMSFPYVVVVTTDPGASPEEVEMDVSAPIEAALASTTNIKGIRSVSNNSYSMVILEYEQNTNMDSRIIEIQQRLEQVRAGFSENIGTPNIIQIDPSMLPVMAVAISYEGKDELELLSFVNDVVTPALESVEGCASVSATSSTGEELIKITIDEKKVSDLNEKLKKAIEDKFKEAKDEISDGKEQISSARDEMNNGSKAISDGIAEIQKQKEELKTKKAELNTQLEGLKKQRDDILAMKESIPNFEETPYASGLAEIEMGIAGIEAGLKQIDEGEVQLDAALENLNLQATLAALNMATGSGSLAEAASGLNSAEGQVESAEKDAVSGANLNNIITIDTITNLLKAQNFDMPAGYVLDEEKNYLIRVKNRIESMSDLKDLVLMDMGFDEVGVIRLSDVAEVKVEQEETNGYAVVNGENASLVTMQKQTGYSTGQSTSNLKKTFERLENEYEGLKISILMDQSVYINMIVKGVIQDIILGAILACIVLLIFLRSFRPTIIIALSIPISVIFAIMVMYFTGISLNMISLSGLALGIGMLVDNSIVAVENIYRLRAQGLSITEAAIKGVNEIAGAITASTLTTVSVYAPIVFTDGVTRQLFVDLALTILFTLMASLIVAITVVPAMAGTLLKKGVKENNSGFNAFLGLYEKVLNGALNHKIITFILAVAILVGSGLGTYAKGLDFLSMEIEADQLSATISSPEDKDYDFDTLKEKANEALEKLYGMDGVETIGATGGGSGISLFGGGGGDSITVYMVLDPDTKRTLKEISEEVKERTKDVDVSVSVTTDSMDYTAMFSSGLSVEIKGRDIDTLLSLSEEVTKIFNSTEGLEEATAAENEDQAEFRIIVDREKAAEYKYTVAQVYALVAERLASSRSAATVNLDKEYDIYIQTEEQASAVLGDIENLTFEFTDSEGETKDVSIKEFTTFEKVNTLSKINRTDQQRVITVSTDVKEGYNVTLVANAVNAELEKLSVPDGYEIKMTGEDETIRDAMKQLLLMMLLAVIFIYLIMVAQFQSLKSPFIIMFTIPLAFTGGFLALLLTGKVLNVIAMLGFIMLSGLIVNNGIVLIDYINRQREEGMSKREAIVTAGTVRLRPVLMTVLTTVLSVSTIALGIGDGATMMQSMAIVLIGGLVYGTILTLIVVPCIYDVFHREKNVLY